MDKYYEDEEFVIPYEKVLFLQWANELGEMALKVNFAAVQGSDSFWRLSLTGKRADQFFSGYREWLKSQ